jgi:hypothetical protein
MKYLSNKSRAFRFVLIIGIMSFFPDFTYEGSCGIIGPYSSLLGANCLVVKFAAVPVFLWV